VITLGLLLFQPSAGVQIVIVACSIFFLLIAGVQVARFRRRE